MDCWQQGGVSSRIVGVGVRVLRVIDRVRVGLTPITELLATPAELLRVVGDLKNLGGRVDSVVEYWFSVL